MMIGLMQAPMKAETKRAQRKWNMYRKPSLRLHVSGEKKMGNQYLAVHCSHPINHRSRCVTKAPKLAGASSPERAVGQKRIRWLSRMMRAETSTSSQCIERLNPYFLSTDVCQSALEPPKLPVPASAYRMAGCPTGEHERVR
eukprot:scaffold17817_cov33-Tisochrysis_lutea.AAC.2